MNLICRIFGHKFKVYHRKKSRTGPELNEFKKCKRCKHTEKVSGQTIIIPQMARVTVADLIGEKGGDK